MTARLPVLLVVLCFLVPASPARAARRQEPQDRTAGAVEAARAFDEVARHLAAAAACGADEGGRILAETAAAAAAHDRALDALGVREGARLELPAGRPRGDMAVSGASLAKAARGFEKAAGLYRAGEEENAAKESSAAAEAAIAAQAQDAVVTDGLQVFCILLAFLALLFALNHHAVLGRVFKVVPLLVFAYFVPTVLSNTGIIPLDAPLYTFIKKTLLPASLVLLVLSVDIRAIMQLGRNAVLLFFWATLTIVISGPLAYLACAWLVPEELGEQAWKGLAALSGSWIGGGANFVAIGESVGATASTISMMVVVDVAVANTWLAVLLFFAGREREMDARIGADRASIDAVRERVEHFERRVSRPTNLPDLLAMLAIAFCVTALATACGKALPDVGEIVREFTWVVLIVTTVAVALSFTRVRNLEGAGASKLGSVMLYLLVASIGAHAQFAKVVEVPSLVVVGAVWMAIHAALMFVLRNRLHAPIFFLAVGSKANVGGAASAPIVASAFHPSLATVGVLLAVGGYVLGTYAGLLCAALLEQVHGLVT